VANTILSWYYSHPPIVPSVRRPPKAQPLRFLALSRRLIIALTAYLFAFLLLSAATGLLRGSPRGAADNGDGYRLYCGAGLVPATPDIRSDWKGGVVLEFSTGQPRCPNPIVSSGLDMLQLASPSAPGQWSLSTLGWLYVAAAAAATAVAAWAATAVSLNRLIAPISALIPLAEPAFNRFFLSTYSEPAGLLGVYVLLLGAAAIAVTDRTHRAERVGALALVITGGGLGATAKVAYIPVLAIAALICAATTVQVGRARSGARLVGPLAAIFMVAFCVGPIKASLDWQTRNDAVVNAHNLAFTLLIAEVGPNAAPGLGLPNAAANYVGQAFFPQGGVAVPGSRLIAADPARVRFAAYQELAHHPAALARAVLLGLQATQGRTLDYLPVRPWTPAAQPTAIGATVGEQGANASQLRAWLDTMPAPWWPSLLTTLSFLAGALTVFRRRTGLVAALTRIAALAATTAVALTVIAVLGDGYFEIAKHVWLVAYLLDVGLVALACATVSTVIQATPGRRTRSSASRQARLLPS
jgi:hypothetical protein